MKIIEVKNYAEAEEKCPKGFYFPYIGELIKLIQEGKAKELFKYEKGKYRFFLTKQTKEDFDRKIVRRVDRGRLGAWLADWGNDLDLFVDGCRVVYLKKEKTSSIEGKEISIMAEGYDNGFLDGMGKGIQEGKAEAKLEFEKLIDKLKIKCTSEQNIGWHNCLVQIKRELKETKT